MATINTLVLNDLFSDFLTTAINREAVLLSIVRKMPYRQTAYKWDVSVGGARAVGQPIAADAPAASYDTVIPASIGVDSFSLQHTFVLNAKEVEVAKEQVSAPELKNLMQALMSSAVENMANAVNRRLYSGIGSVDDAGIIGIDTAIGTGDYAGISSTKYTVWKSVVHEVPKQANGKPGAIGTRMLFNMEAAIRVRGGRYDLIVTHPQVMAEYKSLFQSTRSFLVPGSSQSLIDLGFGSAEYAGIPIIQDPFVPVESYVNQTDGITYYTSKMYFLRLEDLMLLSVPTEGSSTRVGGLYTQMDTLSKTALYVTRYVVGLIPALVLRSRKNCGVIKGIGLDGYGADYYAPDNGGQV